MKKKNKKYSLFAKLFDPKMFVLDFARLTAWPALLFYRMKVLYENKNAKKFRKHTGIIASNHTGFGDVPIIYSLMLYRRICFVTAKEVYKPGFSTFFYNSVGCIKIDRENPSIQTFKSITNCLDRGHYVGVFPEGSINREEAIKTFKSGVVMMALMANKPIIPIYIKRRKNWFQRQRVAVGEPIYLNDYFTSRFPSMEEIEKVTNLVRDKEIKLKELVGE